MAENQENKGKYTQNYPTERKDYDKSSHQHEHEDESLSQDFRLDQKPKTARKNESKRGSSDQSAA